MVPVEMGVRSHSSQPRRLHIFPHYFHNIHHVLLDKLWGYRLTATLVSRFLINLQEVNLRSVKVGSDHPLHLSAHSNNSLPSFVDATCGVVPAANCALGGNVTGEWGDKAVSHDSVDACDTEEFSTEVEADVVPVMGV